MRAMSMGVGGGGGTEAGMGRQREGTQAEWAAAAVEAAGYWGRPYARSSAQTRLKTATDQCAHHREHPSAGASGVNGRLASEG